MIGRLLRDKAAALSDSIRLLGNTRRRSIEDHGEFVAKSGADGHRVDSEGARTLPQVHVIGAGKSTTVGSHGAQFGGLAVVRDLLDSDPVSVRAHLVESFNGTFGTPDDEGRRLRVRFHDLSQFSKGRYMGLSAEVLDYEGRSSGSLLQTWERFEGRTIATINWLGLGGAIQGRGFSKEMVTGLEQYLTRSRVSEVQLTAMKPPGRPDDRRSGGEFWAYMKYGFDNRTPENLTMNSRSLTQGMQRVLPTLAMESDISRLRKLGERVQNPGGRGFPSTQELLWFTGADGRRLGNEILAEKPLVLVKFLGGQRWMPW